MKKIIAMIKPSGPLYYFVNEIHRHHPIHTVIIEDKHLGQTSLFRRIQTRLALGKRTIRNHNTPLRLKKKSSADLFDQYFNNQWLGLDSSLRVVYCRHINDENVARLLEAEKPDLLLDHGTSIVTNAIIDKAPLTLNLHWGLSPFYRGTHCTEWALLNRDPFNIGVTIHRLTQRIDGGDVLGQERITIQANDTVDSINIKLTIAGTSILVNALSDWQQGRQFKFHKQQATLGRLTLNKDWNRELKKEIRRIETQGGIRTMLESSTSDHAQDIVNYEPTC